MIAEVIIDSKAKTLNRKFDYKIPKDLEDVICVGSRVLVPFARMKSLEQGYVIKIKNSSNFDVKEIAGLDENLSKEKMDLARWMARKYFCNLSECIKLMITPGNRSKEKRVLDKKINFIYLNIDKQEINLEDIRGEKQKKALEFVMKNEGMTIPEIMEFTDVQRASIDALIKKGYLKICKQKIERNPLECKNAIHSENLKLTDEQKYAFDKISDAIDKKRFEQFLIYGVTGSGKTEVYMQLIQKVVKKDETAILLVPEISLTPQMLERFIGRFGKEKLAVLHSKLSIGERHDEWKRIKENKARIVIGARSAIFAPVKDLGLIIIDEEHDSSYKSEAVPRYDAKMVSKKIAQEQKIPLLLGSATPDIVTYYKATEGKEITLLELTKRANNAQLPKIEIVDLKQELASGNRSMLSRELYKDIEENLKNKHQTILFLNRRGYSTFIMCRECGYTVKCDNCNVSMTYHGYENKLKCHYCGAEKPVVTKCPECGSDKIRYFGTGTQKLEQEIIKQFPRLQYN